MPLGARVLAARQERGWSQAELSRRSGVRQSLISELESGKRTDTTGRILLRLATVLHVSLDWLVGRYCSEGESPCISPGERHSLDGTTSLPLTTP
jgi:transcriptional regulator with XRE-family HTH domain